MKFVALLTRQFFSITTCACFKFGRTISQQKAQFRKTSPGVKKLPRGPSPPLGHFKTTFTGFDGEEGKGEIARNKNQFCDGDVIARVYIQECCNGINE